MNQELKKNDQVELNNGKTAKVISVSGNEVVVECKTTDGLCYERTFNVNEVKKV